MGSAAPFLVIKMEQASGQTPTGKNETGAFWRRFISDGHTGYAIFRIYCLPPRC